jgi:hypothetical protein
MSDKCNTCKKKVVKEGLKCDYCDTWSHRECERITPEEYTLLKNPRFPWYCTTCHQKAVDVVKFIGGIKEEHEAMKKRLDEVEKKLTKVDDMEATVQELSCNFADKVKESLTEITQQEARRNNLVVSNLPERTKANEEDESDEESEDTTGLVTELITEGLGLDSIKIGSAKRVPEKRRDDGKPRIIIVAMDDKEDKHEVLKASKKLRESTKQEWKKVYINPDLTKLQREKDFQLRQELKRRKEAGEKDLIIKSGRIIMKDNNQGDSGKPTDKGHRKPRTAPT